MAGYGNRNYGNSSFQPQQQGNFYARKRKNTDEYDDDFKKQRLLSEPSVIVEDELEATLYRLGEINEENVNLTVESNIETTASYVLSQVDERNSEIINILIECASKLPEKQSIYSTLIGLLNLRNPNFVEEIINALATSLRENLRTGSFFIVHRLVRFISDLVNVKVITTKSNLNIYEKFIDVTNEENSPQVRTDFYVYCVLSCIPWNGVLLYEHHGPEFDELLESIKVYIGKRQKDYMPLLKVWSNDDPHMQEEYLDCLWIQIKKLEDNDWKESQINRPYAAFANSLSNSIPHDFPIIIPPEMNATQTLFPLPRVIFRMFDYTDVPEEFILPGAHSIERYLVEEQLHSVINTYYLDRKLCASKLLSLKVTNRIPLNYMIVEIVMGHLFSLPKTPLIELFYGSLLLELCKLQPNFMPQVLAQATELLFERINSMKASCIERLASWFAYHLSNFQYKWSWEDWKQDGEDQHDLETPKNKFLRETLIRCMRLAYHQRITDIIPQSMGALVPANPKPTYKYESEAAADLEGTSVANKLLELFRERAIPEDVFQVLRDIPDKYNEADDEYETFNPLKIEVFTSTLLYFGSKSFSHAFAALAKYHTIFKILFDNENSQLVILKALHEIWKNHQQMMVVMVDKMLKTQIVECASVAKWIFSTDMNQELTSFYVWEILHATISRMSKQVDKVKHEYMQLSQKFNKPSLDENESNEVTEDEHDAKLQTLNLLKEQQKTLFMVIIKRFMECLSEHKSNADLEIKVEVGEKALIADSPYWQKWASDRFEDIFLVHNEEILPILDDVKAELVTPATPKHISKIFKMILSLKK